MCMSYASQRFCKLGWFLPVYQNVPALGLAIAYFFIYYPFHVENLINCFMLLNRLTSVLNPLNYEKKVKDIYKDEFAKQIIIIVLEFPNHCNVRVVGAVAAIAGHCAHFAISSVSVCAAEQQRQFHALLCGTTTFGGMKSDDF